MRLDVVTIFPEYLDPLRHALLGRAIERGILQVAVHDLRSWAHDVHKAVDDTPYGGGPGMVMKPSVWGPALDDVAALTGPAADGEALESAQPHRPAEVAGQDVQSAPSAPSALFAEDGPAGRDDSDLPLLIVPTPAGEPFTQEMAEQWSTEERLVFACGRYEGIDQRVFEDAGNRYRVQEVSLGDYVLIGGEVAVLVMAEAVVRLVPGVLGNKRSHEEDSFQDGLLEGPSYTKPRVWRDLEVPPVLLSGDHAKVDRWRRDQSLLRTAERRPELLDTLGESGQLSKRDHEVLPGKDAPEK
ncbi:MAG TPA: tRNA (guanosine(37)-N1)-methyltransferase TrmD [Candidatus Corynebacterium avicola]|uniref:tRNA (guanine-N(1)-)-methyltransferase n=1 Tax=Candidatus Corynebacterium avicola TaxID=2838527 RepID=A0A9D1RQ12_9CORY|nr:tRNA (guanosine(37)-N1)-methyltransferase TrmD [Candidatus Corynebacterium avicola]